MNQSFKQNWYSIFLPIIAWGSVWGVFEAVVGYLLHMLPVNVGWLIWYPASCFFMACVYRQTRKISSIIMIGFLCSGIKLLNLLLPGRVDRVINPAVCIVFEAASMALVIYALNRFCRIDQKSAAIKGIAALTMNTGWRILFVLYLIFLVPGWMREISVISNADKFVAFFLIQNIMTSMLLFFGYLYQRIVFWPLEAVGHKIESIKTSIPVQMIPTLKTGIIMLMLMANITLQVLL